MNTTRKALDIVETALNNGHWAQITTTSDGASVAMIGVIHADGFEETPFKIITVDPDGRVIESVCRS